ncbi:MAG TPA: hypothetical protein VGK47_03125, partial [Nitrososphaeraceae archaeon]
MSIAVPPFTLDDINIVLPELAIVALPMLKAQRSLYEFTKQAWPIIEPKEPFVDGMHMRALCMHLEAVSRGQINRLIVNVPPRTAKSTITSVMWPAWDWIENHWRKFLFASHSFKFSLRDSSRCKEIIKSKWYQKNWGHLYHIKKDTESFFSNNHTGSRNITSVSSNATGENADIVVADDINDTRKVFSDKIRDTTNAFFSGTLSMRLNDRRKSSIVIVMQRSHELDVTGYAIANDKDNRWVKFIMPMEYESKRKCVTISFAKDEKPWEDP